MNENTLANPCDMVGRSELTQLTRLRQDNESREIIITKILNGFIVRVECQTVVFETREKLLSELERYLKSPKDVEKEYLTKNKEEQKNG